MSLHEARGLNYGDQLFANNRGIWLWEEENFENLKNVFESWKMERN